MTRPSCLRTRWLGMGIMLGLSIASLALCPAPMAAQAHSWHIAIEQNAMSTACGSQTNIPVPGATSLSAALVVATNVFNTYMVSCLQPQCPAPNTNVITGAASGTVDPYTINGNARTRYQVNIVYTCAPPAARDSVIVKKTIVSPAGVAAPTGPYQIHVVCSPNGPNTNVTLTSPSHLQQAVAVPAGSSCTFTELQPLPPPPPGCTWVTTYPNGQTGKIGQTIEVRNTLRCGPSPKDSVRVLKTIVASAAMPVPNGPFMVHLVCTPSGPTTTLTLTGPGQLLQGVAVPAGSSCAITEVAPFPTLPPGCVWVTTYPNGQVGLPNQKTIEIRNAVRCGDTPTKDSVRVLKTIIATPGMAVPNGPFHIHLVCTPSGPTTNLTLTGPGQLLQGVSVAAGSSCAITEVAPFPTLPPGCVWVTTYPNGQVGLPGQKTIEIRNAVRCGGTPESRTNFGSTVRSTTLNPSSHGAPVR